MKPAMELGETAVINGVSYTVVRIDREHYRRNNDFYQRTLGGITYCHPCPFKGQCNSQSHAVAGAGSTVCAPRGKMNRRMLRTDLIPLFTLEGALA